MRNTNGTLRSKELPHAVRTTLLWLLVALALTSTVSYAQDGSQEPSAEVGAVVEPPATTLPPTDPGEELPLAADSSCDTPPAPTLIAPRGNIGVCDTTPLLDWTDVSTADRYNIQVDDSYSFTSPVIDTSCAASNYTPTSPLERRRWYWRVRSHNECGYGAWSWWAGFDVDNFTVVPVLQAPANGSRTCDRRPYLDWADAPQPSDYRFQLDDAPDFSSPAWDKISSVSWFRSPAPLGYRRYYWRVRGESACGNSAWSEVRHFDVDAAPWKPSAPSPGGGATDVSLDVDLNWADSTHATSYDVYFGASHPPPLLGTVAVSRYNLPTLVADTIYWWQIVAKNARCQTPGPLWRFKTAGPIRNHAPTNGRIRPRSGSSAHGTIQYFTTDWFDEDGWPDLFGLRFHIGRVSAPKSLVRNVVLLYTPGNNKIKIRSRKNTRWWGGEVVGSDNVVEGSEAKVHCKLCTVTRSGNMVRLRWAIEFDRSFVGDKIMYLKAKDLEGAKTPYQQKGTWTVR
jgi:hypothetical protein